MIEKIKTAGLGDKIRARPNLGRELNVIFSDTAFTARVAFNLKGAILAFGFFIYFFVQNGTLGLFPEKWYIYYRSIRLSDLVQYMLIIYSFIKIKEYSDLFKSRSLLLPKIFLVYIIFEFFWSAINYHFDVIEYFFRLKGLWSSFLIFPFLLLLKRNGLIYLIKLIFPFAVLSNILYIMTAVTGVAFLPDVSIYVLKLPFEITVYRVYGGTFYGEMYMLGFIYFWITKKFKFYQVFLVILFLIPHILSFGRSSWVTITFTIFLIFILGAYYKKNYKNIIRQTVILAIFFVSLIIVFSRFYPDAPYMADALKERLFQGGEDITYSEGTYDTRVHFQTNSLLKLWQQSNVLVGVGMHPFWIVRPENYEEQVWYNALCDVTWPAVLAAYGLVGLFIAVCFQFYFIFVASKMMLKVKEVDMNTYFLTTCLCSFYFSTFITYSYNLINTGLWGFYTSNIAIAFFVYIYEKNRKKIKDDENNREENQTEFIKMNGALKKIRNNRFYLNSDFKYKNNGQNKW